MLSFVKWYTDQQFQAGYDKATAHYESTLRKDLNDEIKHSGELQTAINNMAVTWLNEKPRIEYKYEQITTEVPKYIKDNRQCDLTRGAVSLYNDAADPEKQLPENIDTALTNAEEQTPSTISQRAATKHCIGWAEQYNELAKQHDSLIDVLLKN